MGSDFLNDKVVFISGGTGSFGRTMVEYLLSTGVGEVRVFSRDEKKQEELRFHFRDARLRTIVGDVRDRDSMKNAVAGTEYLFHAAALKQVPSCEFNPFEAVKTNILGAQNVIDTAIDSGVNSLVVLSTDKAVYPINAMGTSKAMMEKLAIAKARECFLSGHQTKINVTRYGNVMGSRGSVIPLFLNQIRAGENITVTNPQMTRFMMSLKESIGLVLFAFSQANHGDLVVRKSSGATVLEVAESLRRLCGANNEIKVIGARHGEKMHETLCSYEEMATAIDEGEFYRIPADFRDISTANVRETGAEEQSSNVERYTSQNTERLKQSKLDELLSNYL